MKEIIMDLLELQESVRTFLTPENARAFLLRECEDSNDYFQMNNAKYCFIADFLRSNTSLSEDFSVTHDTVMASNESGCGVHILALPEWASDISSCTFDEEDDCEYGEGYNALYSRDEILQRLRERDASPEAIGVFQYD
jgi:hypothetical protein